ncbi:MAG TPA: hypothetical protein VE571_07390 [Solirubrobacteraceae bacterium]|nr:hypothetical protein [Solirubrobacteraceae bacterium]
MSREMALLRRRLASLGHGFTVRQSGTASIVVTAPKRAERGQIVPLLTPSAQLRFSDWEANVLTPNGKTVASQLLTQDHTAVLVSQGAGEGPGFAGAGSRPLYEAATLGAAQPRSGASRFLSRLGPEYYLFGRPGSRACAAVAAAHGSTPPIPSTHCLLAGPLDPGSSVSRARAIGELAAQLPAGVASSQGQVVVVPQGTLIVKAQPLHSLAPEFSSPGAQFFVMRDRVALTGSDITHPRASTDAGGAPSVTFNFTRTGRAAFQQATRAIAHRGAHVSLGGETLDQHFAVALDNQLVTVPSIDFRQYPDGVPGANGADITGGLTPATARDMATQLRYGALPLALRVTQIN